MAMSRIASGLLRSKRFVAAFRQYSAAVQEAVETPQPDTRKGLVLGVYSDDKAHKLTPAAAKFSSMTGGKLEELIKEGPHLSRGKYHIFQNLDAEFYSVAVVGLGKEDVGFDQMERMDECKESIRCAVAVGARALRSQGIPTILSEGFGNAEAAAEGATLAVWRHQEQKSAGDQKVVPSLELYFDEDKEGWQRGVFKAEAQNLARKLSDTSANLMTPTLFAQAAVDVLCPCGINVEIHDKDWCETRKMNAFLSVARGSCEPPLLMEMGYCGGAQGDKPIVLCGKGLTFESGGLCLLPCKGMSTRRGEMNGAAVCVAVMRAAAALSLPINIQAVVPLCENMISGMAMKPGDHYYAMNNAKSIQIDKTDNEGRIVMADALVYAQQAFKPKLLMAIGSHTNGMETALGFSATGVFTNSDPLWKQLEAAGGVTGDRVWRFPMWKHHAKKVTKTRAADMTNVGQGGGSPCRCAAFLREYIDCGDYILMDTSSKGLLADCDDYPYLSYGRMTGSPARTVVQFLYQMCCDKTAK